MAGENVKNAGRIVKSGGRQICETRACCGSGSGIFCFGCSEAYSTVTITVYLDPCLLIGCVLSLNTFNYYNVISIDVNGTYCVALGSVPPDAVGESSSCTFYLDIPVEIEQHSNPASSCDGTIDRIYRVLRIVFFSRRTFGVTVFYPITGYLLYTVPSGGGDPTTLHPYPTISFLYADGSYSDCPDGQTFVNQYTDCGDFFGDRFWSNGSITLSFNTGPCP